MSGIPAGTELVSFQFPKLRLAAGEAKRSYYKWTANHDVIGIGLGYEKWGIPFLNPQFQIGDGMNNVGFSAAALWLPGTVFPSVKDRPKGAPLLSSLDIVCWAMSTYEFVEDLKKDLLIIQERYKNPDKEYPDADRYPAFWNPFQENFSNFSKSGSAKEDNWKNAMPLHYQFHDKTGASLVLEFRNGKMEITDNEDLGVITNNPFLDWHITNLGNYLNVTNKDVEERKIVRLEMHATGDGGSTVGLPASPLPSARFIRAVFLLDFAKKWLNDKKTSKSEALAWAFNLLGNVSVPRNMADQPEGKKKWLYDFTQVILVRDHHDSKLYLRTGYGIGTWELQFDQFIKQKPLCTKLKNLNSGVPFQPET